MIKEKNVTPLSLEQIKQAYNQVSDSDVGQHLSDDLKTVVDGCGRLLLWAETWSAMQKMKTAPAALSVSELSRMEEMAAELWVKVYTNWTPAFGAMRGEDQADHALKLFRERFQTDKHAGATSAPANQGGQAV